MSRPVLRPPWTDPNSGGSTGLDIGLWKFIDKVKSLDGIIQALWDQGGSLLVLKKYSVSQWLDTALSGRFTRSAQAFIQ